MASSESKSRNSAKNDKSSKTQKTAKKTPPPAAYKSEKFVQDSDEDEIERGEATDEDSNQSSDNDGSSRSAKPEKASSKANGKLPAPSGSSSSSEGESEESSEEEEDSEDVIMDDPVAIEPIKKPSKQPASSAVVSRAPAPYRPPPGFEPASLNGTVKASQMLKKSSLEGKQIWYFTAPASVPISSIEAMSLLDAKNGKIILSHEGNDYGFMKDSTEDTTYMRIMVPSSDAGYKATSKPIDQVFHLQQIAKDPTTANLTRATIPAKKPVRQQPRGLKMRFHPIGFGAEQPGVIGSSSSDEEMDNGPSTASRPVPKSKGFVRPEADSDEEMEDSPPLPLKPHPENYASASSPDGTSKKEKKRKHREGGEKKSKNKKADRISEKASRQSISVN